jgi:DSF synthase
MLRARRRILPITKSELLDITEEWAESAFHLEEKDIAYMERLLLLQNRIGVKRSVERKSDLAAVPA